MAGARRPRARATAPGSPEGIIADRWAPAAPNGTLDAFVWRTPDERLADPPPAITLPPAPPPAPPVAPPPPAVTPPILAKPARRAGPPRAQRPRNG